MAKKPFMPRTALGKQSWLQNFSNKLNNYAAKYNITVAAVKDMLNSYAYLIYWAGYRSQYEEYVHKLTAFENELEAGIPAGASASVEPTPPVIAS